MRALYFLLIFLLSITKLPTKRTTKRFHHIKWTTKPNPATRTTCMSLDTTLRARHKTCFLRPDTGPCRADLLMYYFDVRMRQCFKFFWGGCQGNGNRFETKEQCKEYCHLNTMDPPARRPYFCNLDYDYGTCFGAYNRWAYDKVYQSCRRRLYSGCGGNQNNFETQRECFHTCIARPNSTFSNTFNHFNICIPFNFRDLD